MSVRKKVFLLILSLTPCYVQTMLKEPMVCKFLDILKKNYLLGLEYYDLRLDSFLTDYLNQRAVVVLDTGECKSLYDIVKQTNKHEDKIFLKNKEHHYVMTAVETLNPEQSWTDEDTFGNWRFMKKVSYYYDDSYSNSKMNYYGQELPQEERTCILKKLWKSIIFDKIMNMCGYDITIADDESFEKNCNEVAKKALSKLSDQKFFESDFFKKVTKSFGSKENVAEEILKAQKENMIKDIKKVYGFEGGQE